MNGKQVLPGPDGQALLHMQAPSTPGLYHVPVTITFTDPNGNSSQRVTKIVEYHVVAKPRFY